MYNSIPEANFAVNIDHQQRDARCVAHFSIGGTKQTGQIADN
jgi:hypothetical protein